ncbi:MAG: DNA methyltransferase, partial [Nitrospirota bacterium]|nr:DNA methyltransferase [Nitrospirota bacterium]
MGSGTTLIASYLHNRKGIGIDIDKDYCDIA